MDSKAIVPVNQSSGGSMKNQTETRISETDLSETRTSEIIRITQRLADELATTTSNFERRSLREQIDDMIEEVDSRKCQDPSHISAARALKSYVEIKTARRNT